MGIAGGGVILYVNKLKREKEKGLVLFLTYFYLIIVKEAYSSNYVLNSWNIMIEIMKLPRIH